MKRKSALLLLVLLVASCASSRQFQEADAVKDENTIVYFYWPAEAGAAAGPVAGREWFMTVNGRPVGMLAPGEYTWIEVPARTYTVLGSVDGVALNDLALDPVADASVFVSIRMIDGEARQLAVEPGRGRQEIETLLKARANGLTRAQSRTMYRRAGDRLVEDLDRPWVTRAPYLYWKEVTTHFDDACVIRILYRFHLDRNGFAHDIDVIEAPSMNQAAVEWAREYFAQIRFRPLTKTGRRIAHDLQWPLLLVSPAEDCDSRDADPVSHTGVLRGIY